MTEPVAHRQAWKISDVVMFPALAIAILIELLAPSTIPGLPFWVLLPFGMALVVAGFRLVSASKVTLDKYEQPSLPGTPTTCLVTDGPFKYSRNPNYLGAISIAVGLGLAVNSLWFLAIAIVCMIVLEVWMIRPEERYLRQRFGHEYEEYTRNTRRWL
nr:isoprenylcysteine carboxylmethyltransferase family protein [uncultured Aliiroseovarius sp.]